MRKVERKWYFSEFSWRKKWAKKLVKLECFFSDPTRMQSPQFERKRGTKVPPERDQITTCNVHFQFVIFFFFDHTFLLSFCLFLLRFIVLFLLGVHLFFLSSSVSVFFPNYYFFLSLFGFLYSFFLI